MVYQGPSRACARCKQRHIKCDETRPSCRNCLKRQLECPGYAPEPGIRFQDETSSTIYQAQQREQRRPPRRAPAKDVVAASQALSEDTEAFALNFFFENYATLGRGYQSSRGMFELVVPIYSSASSTSAMAAATSAVALTLTSEWHGKPSDAPLARKHLGKALSLLRSSLNDATSSLTDSTMMAVLLLKFHDMLVACKNLKEIPEDHVNGAIALVKHRRLANLQHTETSKRLLQYVRHTAISCAIQRRAKLDTKSELWMDSEGMPKTPCIDLDWIGVNVANLWASNEAQKMGQLHHGTTVLSEKQRREIRHVRDQAAKLEISLSTWSDRLGARWRPTLVSNISSLDPTIQDAGLYGGFCHLYPSAQVASIWNLHRDYCLHVLELLLRCEAFLEPNSSKQHVSHYATTFSNIVDDLCASVPFLLGNRAQPSSIDDFDLTTGVKFPKHPDDSTTNTDNLEMDMFMDREQRTKSLLAQGAWRLQDHFLPVLRFVNSDVGQALAPLIHPGQAEWMQKQIQRCLKIQRIETKGKRPELKSRRSSTSIRGGTDVSNSAVIIASGSGGKAKGKGKSKPQVEEDEGV